MNDSLLNRFIRYARIDTRSDENSQTTPSTAGQFDLARHLVYDLEKIGMASIELDDRCYVYARLPANIPSAHPAFEKTPKIGFIAHLDTSPSVSGKNVYPQVISNYRGGDIRLNHEFTIKESENPALKESVGQTLITADGTTLLGADDKSGIAIIMTAISDLIKNPDTLHPDICIAFTPDEEIGRGALHFDLEKFDADFAYTVDGGPAGEINNETFSANAALITIKGRDIHPGEARGIMINALKVAASIVSFLPRDMAPETTWKRQPFIHPHSIEGQVGEAVVKLLLRAFDDQILKEQQTILEQIISRVQATYPGARITLDISQTYRNMKDRLDTVPQVSQYLEAAVKRTGLDPCWVAIRGGTDGSGLTAMGLPCPNIFTGGHNFHGPTEWVSLDIMEKSVETVLNLIQVCMETA